MPYAFEHRGICQVSGYFVERTIGDQQGTETARTMRKHGAAARVPLHDFAVYHLRRVQCFEFVHTERCGQIDARFALAIVELNRHQVLLRTETGRSGERGASAIGEQIPPATVRAPLGDAIWKRQSQQCSWRSLRWCCRRLRRSGLSELHELRGVALHAL